MDSLTIQLVSKASAQLLPDKTISSLAHFIPEQLNLESQWEGAILDIFCQKRYQKVKEEKFLLSLEKRLKSSEKFYLQPCPYLSFTDIVEAMNTVIQGRHRHNENCFTVEMLRRMQKAELYLAIEEPGSSLFSTDLGYVFRSKCGNYRGVMLRGKEHHKPKFTHDFVRIHSLMI